MKPLSALTKDDIKDLKLVVFDVDGVTVKKGTQIEEIKTETGASNSIFADSPVIYFLGNYTNNYRFFYISSSVSSVFNLSDFCEFSNTQDYLILTYRKKFLGEDNLICIDNKFELKKRFEPIGDSFVELWKRK